LWFSVFTVCESVCGRNRTIQSHWRVPHLAPACVPTHSTLLGAGELFGAISPVADPRQLPHPQSLLCRPALLGGRAACRVQAVPSCPGQGQSVTDASRGSASCWQDRPPGLGRDVRLAWHIMCTADNTRFHESRCSISTTWICSYPTSTRHVVRLRSINPLQHLSYAEPAEG
ncbi:unnamed protein product, partial [Ixodes pacificus]